MRATLSLSRALAACCSDEVVNGGCAWRTPGWERTETTRAVPAARIAPAASRAAASSAKR